MHTKFKEYIKQYDYEFEEDLWREIEIESKLISVDKNEILIPVGSLHKYVYFVVAGSMVTSMVSDDGDQKAIWFNFDDQFNMVVARDSFFLGEKTRYEVKALEDTKVIRFHKRNVDQWILNYKSFTQVYIQNIITTYVLMDEMRAYKLCHSPTQFLDYLKQRYPSFLERLPSKSIAHFLGVSPEWYSKLKRKK